MREVTVPALAALFGFAAGVGAEWQARRPEREMQAARSDRWRAESEYWRGVCGQAVGRLDAVRREQAAGPDPMMTTFSGIVSSLAFRVSSWADPPPVVVTRADGDILEPRVRSSDRRRPGNASAAPPGTRGRSRYSKLETSNSKLPR